MSDDGVAFDRIVQGDAVAELDALPKACVDLVFADPPYNLQLERELWRPNLTRVDAVNEDWDQFDTFAAYDDFTQAWLSAVKRVMKPTATIWISGTYHNIFRVGRVLQDLGFWVLNTVTWFKPNAMPNFRGTRLKNDVEFVIWAQHSKGQRYTFHHSAMKRFNREKQLGSVWKIPVCGGQERLRDAQGRKLHPTQKPEELLKRVIVASSSPGDVVLDPFLGSGTTAAVAKWLRRHWIGIEQDGVYVAAARERVASVKPLRENAALLRATQDNPPRVPFKVLVEHGYLQPGQVLYLHRTDYTGVILRNGRVQVGDQVGTIHRLGSRLRDVPSINGWTQWLYDDAKTGERLPIDVLRQQFRRAMDEENDD